MGPLAQIFVAHVADPAVFAGVAPGTLGIALGALIDGARTAWPAFALDSRRFTLFLAERLPPGVDPLTRLAALRASDLYLACAAADGEPIAVAAFESCYLARLPAMLAQLRETPDFIAEVRQILAARLLVADGAARPKLYDYRGTGPLENWVRVAAMRTAITWREKQRRHRPGGGDLDALSAGGDLELDYIKARYRADFRGAFEEALGRLPVDERNLLRHSYLDGLTIDDLAAKHEVHRSTAARWVVRARESLLMELRHGLRERLRVSSGELDSMIGLLESQLDVSIHRLFRSQAGARRH